MVAASQVAEIPGLDKLVACSKDPVWTEHRRSTTANQWRPLVDDVLRKAVGLDFETALAKQKYLEHLLATSKMLKRPTEANRRRLRHNIVTVAKRLWDFGTGEPRIDNAIKQARSTFAPTEIIERFLFPPRSLDAAQLTEPFDASDGWLGDPTMQLKSSREVLNRSPSWKAMVAVQMINKLCGHHDHPTYYLPGYGGAVTTWVNASEHYHIQRMENTIDVNFAIQKLKDDGRVSYFRRTPPNTQSYISSYEGLYERLGVILTKLHIPPMQPLRAEQLNERDLALAKNVYFKKLLRVSCVGCPKSGKLAFPRG